MAMVSTGICIALQPGTVGLIQDRSSMAKKGIKTAGGVIDAGYRGEIKVILWNLSEEPITIEKGNKVAQILVLPVFLPVIQEVPTIEQTTTRGIHGFGSTGHS
jgi:dUTP pyrophosphatase